MCTADPESAVNVERYVFDRICRLDTSLKRVEDLEWFLRFLESYDLYGLPDILTEINSGARPSPAIIDEAANRLFQVSQDRIFRHFGKTGCRRFHASMFLERAVARWAAMRRLGAGYFVLLAAFHSTSRVFTSFKRSVRTSAPNEPRRPVGHGPGARANPAVAFAKIYRSSFI